MTSHSLHVRPILVSTENDIVTLRVEVRQAARVLGLGTQQQAKVTAAASTAARAFMSFSRGATFTIQHTLQGDRPSMKIACRPTRTSSADAANLERLLSLSQLRMLVDDALLEQELAHVTLSLRMWLSE
jgi:hypothetical protein